MSTWLTADQVAALTGLSMGSVYRVASQHRWRKTRTKPRGYLLDDVRATIMRRLDKALTSSEE